jgi:hypothetical protein
LALFVSVTIAIAGWSVAASKNRDHHLFERRLEKRIAMLSDVIDVVEPLLNHTDPFVGDPRLVDKLATARRSVQLFGYREEIMSYEALIKGIESADLPAINEALANLVPRIRSTIRIELGYAAKDIDVSKLA